MAPTHLHEELYTGPKIQYIRNKKHYHSVVDAIQWINVLDSTGDGVNDHCGPLVKRKKVIRYTNIVMIVNVLLPCHGSEKIAKDRPQPVVEFCWPHI